ncbi:MAG: hypothetical protein RL367_2393, partial [Pseudomonadota bacterium]
QQLDEQKIADGLFLNYKEEERSWFAGVARLPIGSQAIVTPGGSATTRYYDPYARAPIRFARDADYVEAAGALFEEATRAALQGFSRPAVSLSGGYDSQAVAAFALKTMPKDQRLLGLTSVPEPGWDGRIDQGQFGDESAHVKALAAMHPRLDLTFVDAAGLNFDHKLDAMFLMAGTAPRNAMNLPWMHEVHARAKTAGCDVILTGSMGNASFSFAGTGAMPGWLMNGQWVRLARELWAARGDHKSFAHAVAANLVWPLLPGPVANQVKRWRTGQSPDPLESWCPLNPDWAAAMRVTQRAADLGFDPDFRPFRSSRAWRSAIMGNAANESGDVLTAMDMIAGIPSRDPTSYRPLFEFCFAIPDDQYLRGGKHRWLARRMLKDSVPDIVLNERRHGSQAADWYLRLGRQHQQLAQEIDRLAGDPNMAAMLNLKRLRQALDQWPDEAPMDGGTTQMTLQLALARGLSTARFIRYVQGGNG